VSPDPIASKSIGLSGILGESSLYKQSSATSSPFLDPWSLPLSASTNSIPGLPSTQGSFSMNDDRNFNVFSNKETSDSDILAINTMLTSDAPVFVPASLKTQSNTSLGGLGVSTQSKSTWEDPALSSFGNVNMLMSFLGDDDSALKGSGDQKPQQKESQGSSRLGIFNKSGYI
jgi:hypothetical protein